MRKSMENYGRLIKVVFVIVEVREITGSGDTGLKERNRQGAKHFEIDETESSSNWLFSFELNFLSCNCRSDYEVC